jgi:uncharacterized protein (TIGR01777 family)
MRYLITGGSGLIGGYLCRQLLQSGHHVTVVSRRPHELINRQGLAVQAVAQLTDLPSDYCPEVVVNLSGAGIADFPWTAARRKQLFSSRIDQTAQLIDWFKTRHCLPTVLLSASAVGFYGNGGEQYLAEDAHPTAGFPHDLCFAWEQQALAAQQLGVRVCCMRFGVVLTPEGGFLSRLKLPFRLGLGGRMGNGQQWFSWIHIADLLAAINFLIQHETLQGVFNITSPHPVRNSEFTQALAQQYHRPAFLPVPAVALNCLGEIACLFLDSQRVIPARIQAAGFDFQFADLPHALANLLRKL